VKTAVSLEIHYQVGQLRGENDASCHERRESERNRPKYAVRALKRPFRVFRPLLLAEGRDRYRLRRRVRLIRFNTPQKINYSDRAWDKVCATRRPVRGDIQKAGGGEGPLR
jgi:hypothetical protein